MIADTEVEVEEPIISPELAAELGMEEGANLVLSGKKKKKHKSDEPSEEVKALAKQLSKKAQKRIAQITQRKEKEAKRDDFLSTIHDHEISEEHRQLLTSTRDINQTQTMKQLLSSIFKKQAAGLTLTAEEAQLLYNSPNQPTASADTRFQPLSVESSTEMDVVVNATSTAIQPHDASIVSFDDIFSSDNVAMDDSDKNKKNKKKSGNKASKADRAAAAAKAEEEAQIEAEKTAKAKKNVLTTAVPPTAAPATSSEKVSLGSGLLAQLKKLKEGNSTTVKATPAYKSLANGIESSSGAVTSTSTTIGQTDESADKNNTSTTVNPAYEVHATQLPVDSQGGIVKSVEKASDNAHAQEAANSSTSTKSALVHPAASGALSKAKTVMQVQRSAEIQAARMELPVCQMEQEIIEAVTNTENDTIILCGETGSGKSTQVPQFLYEAGFGIGGIIGITQPRRVAVTSTAERVSYEMTSGVPAGDGGKSSGGASKKKSSKSKDTTTATTASVPRTGQLVGYQIRFDSSTVGADTKIKFMTDGILLKEVAQDLLLRKYRVVILDEAHERNINTDVLLGMLSKVLPLRRAQAAIEQKKYDSLTREEQENCTLPLQPLKLIIMSATMRVNDFQNPRLFPERMPPIIKVEARQYPVTVHFSKRTETVNYLKETHKKVCQIHKKLPEGGVLVFLSGKQEILYMCHKLAKSLNKKQRVTATVGVEVTSDANAANAASESAIDPSIDVAGLGASAEELMEQQEGPDITALLNATNNSKHSSGKNKSSKNSTSSSTSNNNEGEYKRTMRDILNQDEIDTDSDKEDDDVDSDDEDADSDSDGEGLAMDTTSGDGTMAEPSEEDIFILDGDENSKKRTKSATAGSATSNSTIVSRINSSKSALVTGDSVRDQLLKEALGMDPTAIVSTTTATDERSTSVHNNINSSNDATNATANSEKEEEGEAVPELRAYILPLYALMPAAQQNRVFLPVPPGHRLIVVATNVAETSITIPGIRYVVDSGRQKEKVMTSVTKPADEDEYTAQANNNKNKRAFEGTEVKHKSEVDHGVSNSAGIAKYEVKWVSQAAASQRSGRAGRTGPGHCYRLYSANFYHEYLQPYQPPEITVTPLEELILQMKALGIDHIERFPFPTAPPQSSIRNAITLLTNLGAISAPGSSNNNNTAVVSAQDKNKPNSGSNDLSAQIAMATMNAMKSNSKLAHKQLQQLQELQKQQQLVRDLCPLTQLGKMLSRFPINPRFAKMLVMAYKSVATSGNNVSRETYVLLSHALTMVATLAERSAFDGNTDSANKKPRAVTNTDNSDADSCSEDEAGTILENPGSAKNGSILYYHEDGDALARLRATGAYIHTVLSHIRSVRAAKNDSSSSKGGKNSANNTSGAVNPSHLSKSDVAAANESANVRTLCNAHRLHAPTLQRIVELREQLQDISASVLLPATVNATSTGTTPASSKSLLDVPLAPPTAAQELALRQLLVSGFCDSIARRVPLGVIKTGPRRRRLCAYYSSHPSLQDIPLYIHPGSNLYKSDPTANLPEFITYQNLVRNQRGDCIYMTCVSVVNPLWLSSVAADCPLLKWSDPIMSPAPYFDPHADAVMCFVTPRFGVHNWDLPAMRRSLMECVNYSLQSNNNSSNSGDSLGTPAGLKKENEAYRWFAKLLLEGNVLSNTPSANVKTPTNSGSALNKVPLTTLKDLKNALNKTKLQNGSASMIIELKHDVKINNLLSKLVTREVCSVASLLTQMRGNPRFLLEEIQAFLISRDTKTSEDFKAAWLKLAAHAMSV